MKADEWHIVPGTVYIVGAGPGAPDLITRRGAAVLERADLVVYADSLVDGRLVAPARQRGARVVGSASLTLEEIVTLMAEAARSGQVVARLHSGDPSIYGALHEQIMRLDALGVPWEIVPGVPSFAAAAARLGVELTVPDLVQTVILTRTAGRTPMPDRERLSALATHGATLAIHLSITRIRRVVEELLAGGYPPETPVAVLYKVTWPDERVLTGTLADIADKVRAAGFTRHALILVGPALNARRAAPRVRSHLYNPTHTHRFRRAQATPQAEDPRGTVVIAVTRRGADLALRLAEVLNADVRVPAPFATGKPESAYSGSAVAEVRRCWPRYQALVLVMAAGVAVRAVAPLLRHKTTDPAVVCLDEAGQHVIPLIGGHAQGANELACRIAAFTGGIAAITTASDVQGRVALDLVGHDQGWKTAPGSCLKEAMAALVNGEKLGLFVDPLLPEETRNVALALLDDPHIVRVESPEVLETGEVAAGLVVTCCRHVPLRGNVPLVVYYPPVLCVGVGCRRGVSADEVVEAVERVLEQAELARESVAALATADLKANEPGLAEAARQLGVPLRQVPADALRQVPAEAVSPSAARDRFNVPGVAEPAALLVSGGRLLVPKQRVGRCTVAVAVGEGGKQ